MSFPLLLWCPQCGHRHVDSGEWATKEHHTHACQECGHVWRPAVLATVGVQFLPGFKDGAEEGPASGDGSRCAASIDPAEARALNCWRPSGHSGEHMARCGPGTVKL